MGPDGHPLQVLWVTQLPAGVLYILCSVTGFYMGATMTLLWFQSPCSVRGPSKRVMYHPMPGPGLSPRSKPCLHDAPAAGCQGPGQLPLVLFSPTQSMPSLLRATQRPSRCPGHSSLQWKFVEVGKGISLPNLKMMAKIKIIYIFPLCLPTNLQV